MGLLYLYKASGTGSIPVLMQKNTGNIYQVGPDRKTTLNLLALRFGIAFISYCTNVHSVFFP
jgi:hypothetical protein